MMQARLPQTPAGEAIYIGQIFVLASLLRPWPETLITAIVMAGEGGVNIRANLKSRRPDGRPHPCQQIPWGDRQGGDGCFQHTSGETTPARMRYAPTST